MNRTEVPLEIAHRLLAPRLVYIITTTDKTGRSNAAPFSFLTPVTTQPAALVVSITPDTRTLRNLRQVREFVVNIPSSDLVEKVWICGHKYSNIPIPVQFEKLVIAGLTELPSEKVRPPRILECYAHLECKVTWIRRASDEHSLVLASIIEASVDERALGNDYLVNFDVVKPIMHLTGKQFTTPSNEIVVDEQKALEMAMNGIAEQERLASRAK